MIEMNQVQSGNIDQWGYDPEIQDLQILFVSGGLYLYHNVPTDVAEGLREAPSKGQYFAAYVKNRYPFERLA